MRVMDRVEGAAIDRDLLQSPTLKRSMLNVQLKAFYLNARMTSFVDEKHAERLRIQLAQGICVRRTALERAEARVLRNSFPLVGCSGRLRLYHTARQWCTERPAHRGFRVVLLERDVDRRFQFRHGVRLQQIPERA